MRVGIITFHAVHNYGAVLQAYGLQEFLRSQGHEAYVVDYRPKYLVDIYKPMSLKRASVGGFTLRMKLLLREFMVYPIRKRREKYFNAFINSALQLCALDRSDVGNEFDAFVFGSDQIWNPIICNGLDPMFLGDFPAAKGRLLVSYAGSLGSIKHLSSEQRKELIGRLSKFSALSCREQSLSKFISESLSRKVETVLDPVLLAGRKYFDKLATQVDGSKPYLLLFTLSVNENARQVAYNIAKSKNLRVVEIMSFQMTIKGKNLIQAVPVPDFLGYIRSAEFVVTSSFHGTALSVLFGKELFYVPDDPKTGERAANLLHMLGIGDRVWNDGCENDVSPIDYKSVFSTLDVERKKSADFIKSALG